MKKINKESLIKWIPVIIATLAAGISTLAEGIGDQETEDRIDSMDERIKKLENGES